MPVDPSWSCKRCGSNHWVSASLTGPISQGGRAIRQCVPCGHYSSDPTPVQEDRDRYELLAHDEGGDDER